MSSIINLVDLVAPLSYVPLLFWVESEAACIAHKIPKLPTEGVKNNKQCFSFVDIFIKKFRTKKNIN